MAEEIGELVEVPHYNSGFEIGPRTELIETSEGTVVKARRQAGPGQEPVTKYGLLKRTIPWEESTAGRVEAEAAEREGERHVAHPYVGVEVYVVKHAETDIEKAVLGNALILEHGVDRNEINFF